MSSKQNIRIALYTEFNTCLLSIQVWHMSVTDYIFLPA